MDPASARTTAEAIDPKRANIRLSAARRIKRLRNLVGGDGLEPPTLSV
jgi:hypothetical protein